ncbi:MTH [Lepeophtheirus salmonis]|uniref:MTH n=1 Tax=Lepeophtheirus salmonis TaxID=72036 RepID=A0A7R8CHQ3_LEPSM|nr:MTH [Lepeophtheirus salmonis]CAF2770380.1 MTH [Lepeophtheirus salmonis]
MSWSSQRFLIILILLVVENQSIIFRIFQNCSYRLPNYFLCGDSHKENKSCQCDKDCIEYGDCCFDFARSFIHERTSSLIPLQNCESLNASTEIYMINYCLSNNTDIKNKCEKRADPYNFLMDIPVTSSKTLVTYSNIFCALCHDDISLRAFNYSLSCSNQNIIEACGLSVSQDICSDENYNPKTRSWTKFLQPNDSKNNCTIAGYPITCQLNLLVDIPNMRLCQTNVKRTCSLVDTVGLIYCNLYSLPLEYEGNIYQNPHCAVCNKLALEQLNICSQEYSRRYLYKKSGIMKEYISSKEFELSFKDIRCEDDDERSNYFWNSFNSECYYVDCGKLYENQNGKCNYQNFTKQLDGNCNKHFGFDALGSKNIDKWNNSLQTDKNIQFLHEICTSLSLISLSMHIFIHTALKKLRNLFVQNILGLSCALFIYQFIMITGLTYNDSHSICMFIATMLHYFQLVAYSWLDIICYDLYRTLLVKDLTN